MTTTSQAPSAEQSGLQDRFARDGYVTIPNALTPEQLAPLVRRFDQLIEALADERRRKNESAGRLEVKRILQQDPVFEPLMACPTTFPLARAIIGADITLASGGEGDFKGPHTPAHIGWHSDFQWMVNVPYPRQNFWLRCTYFLDDVTQDNGPFTLLPGSHLRNGPPPADFNGPDGQPREVPGMMRITGKAGTCLINNTEIWHTNTPNRTDRARKLIMIVYKHAWMRQWEGGYELTPEFGAAQTDPLRRQLCNVGEWHRTDGKWDA